MGMMMEETLTAGAGANADTDSDFQLVTLVRQGRGAAFAQIMRRNNRRLFRLVRAIVQDDFEAEEVVQETYVRAFAALASWRGDSSLSTWLSRIALNEALGLVQRRRKTVDFEAAAETQAPGGTGSFDHLLHPSPEAVAARAEIRHLIERAVDGLPADFRAVFMLRAIEQLSVEETAATLEILPETVRTRFFRARRLLRRALGKQLASVFEDIFPFAGARCDRIMAQVFQRLSIAGEPASADATWGLMSPATESKP
jgi:RNA polymerase sigma-70 factor (ECF subfamily)